MSFLLGMFLGLGLGLVVVRTLVVYAARSNPWLFLERRGTYWRTWRCRWSRIKCALGLHAWWLGPYAAGDPPGHVRDVFVPDHLVAEFCGGGSPGCTARRIVKRDRWTRMRHVRKAVGRPGADS